MVLEELIKEPEILREIGLWLGAHFAVSAVLVTSVFYGFFPLTIEGYEYSRTLIKHSIRRCSIKEKHPLNAHPSFINLLKCNYSKRFPYLSEENYCLIRKR